MKSGGYKLALGGVFLAAALVVPMIFHAVGLGSSFMPMFIPLALAGFLVGPSAAISVGLLAPLLSSLLTAMPPLSPPIAPLMMFEGVVMTGIIAWLFPTRFRNPWICLLLGLIGERLALLMGMQLIAQIWNLPGFWLGLGALLRGLPGIGLILFLVPPLVKRLHPMILAMERYE